MGVRGKMSSPMIREPTEFDIAVTNDELDDLRPQLRSARWPEREPVDEVRSFFRLVP
jgi:hypothetical protein